MVSTLDFESSDPSSNLGGTSLFFVYFCWKTEVIAQLFTFRHLSKSSKTIKSKDRLFTPPPKEEFPILTLEQLPGGSKRPSGTAMSSSFKEAENVSMLMAACQQGLPHDVLVYINKKVS